MLVRYLRLSMWPSSLVVNYGWPKPLTLTDVFPSALCLAVSLSALGQLDEAVSAFRRAVEMNPADSQARRNLTIALEDQAQAVKR